MENTEDSQTPKFFARFVRVGIFSLAMIALGCITGWIFDIQFLKSIFPGLVTMKFNTALSFLAASGSLFCSYRMTISKSRRLVGTALGFFVFSVGALTLSQYAFGLDFGIDQLIVRGDFNPINTGHPGRMAPATATAFIISGISLIFLPNGIYGSHWLATSGFILGLIAILGYMFGSEPLHGFGSYTSIALHAAASLMVLNLSILFSRPKMGYMGTISSSSLGGIAARKLLIFIPATAICIGQLCLMGSQLGWYDDMFRLSLITLLGILSSSFYVIKVSEKLNKSDDKQKLAEKEILELNSGLEARIQERTKELQQALDNIKRLEGFIPICAWCKRIRDDKNYWSSVEVYISERTNAQFSHAICPSCQEIVSVSIESGKIPSNYLHEKLT